MAIMVGASVGPHSKPGFCTDPWPTRCQLPAIRQGGLGKFTFYAEPPLLPGCFSRRVVLNYN